MHDPLRTLLHRLTLSRRMRTTQAESPGTTPGREDIAERSEELLQRRLALDPRRGPLGEFHYLYAELAQLDDQRQRGAISEDEYEAAKRRLLDPS